jgi:hypothetical protein
MKFKHFVSLKTDSEQSILNKKERALQNELKTADDKYKKDILKKLQNMKFKDIKENYYVFQDPNTKVPYEELQMVKDFIEENMDKDGGIENEKCKGENYLKVIAFIRKYGLKDTWKEILRYVKEKMNSKRYHLKKQGYLGLDV